MPFELIREYITLDQEVNAFNTQTSLEEIIKIPDFKPNMRSILLIDGEVNTSSQAIEGNVLNVEGDIQFKIYYVAEGGYLDCAQAVAPFDYAVELSDLEGDIECLIKAGLEHVDFRITNSRKVNVRSIMKIEGKLIKKSNFPLLVDVKEMANIQKLHNKITITKSTVKKNETITVQEKITMEEKDETSLKLIDSSFTFTDIKSSKSPSGVLITGRILGNTLYSEDTDEKKVYKNIPCSMNFSQFIEKTGVENIDSYFFIPKIKSQNIDFSAESESETISLNYDLAVETYITFYENVDIENIQDLYSPEIQSHVEKDIIKTYSLIENFEERIEISEEVILTPEMPVEQLLFTNSKTIITATTVGEDNITFEGILKTEYIISEVELIEKFDKEIPFSYTLKMRSMDYEISDFAVSVDSLRTNLRGNAIEVEGAIIIKGNLFNKISLNLVKSVNEIEETEVKEVGEFYTIKAHYKQPQESLWEIAKVNCTTVDRILSDNKLESEEMIKEYMPLVILH
ncbi:DUF3794 domain-containing protein [Alkalibaculum sp. M08DMB]|uniref:DUF3794 domain-containing protein n=1 Tax=Alkalibaculum sporogenes TaxID=2655001 RepID=A0A6A7KD42_9FIRM|nr:DUF3794 domain-containing protein [Alkalibaculum sporogenes]MPW27262.1 DUF3794 domain-containing protein [Alkalibaculum sporogenes]